MTETQTTTAYQQSSEGIVGLTVEVKASAEYQTVGTALEYRFGVPVQPADVLQRHNELQTYASELAVGELRAHLDRKKAETHPNAASPQAAPQAAQQPAQAAAQPAPAQPSQPAAQPAQAAPAQPQQPAQPQGQQPSGGLLQGSKPQGKGTFQYPSTFTLPEELLKEQVREGIVEAGYDPDHFVVYDNRTGNNGLEAGGQAWSFATARAADNTAWQQHIGKSAAFYIDAQDAHHVTVKPSKKLAEATA